MNKCKHMKKYTILEPVESDGSENMKSLKETGDLRSFLMKHQMVDDVPYDLLSSEYKKIVDEMYAERALNDTSVLCTRECLNSVVFTLSS